MVSSEEKIKRMEDAAKLIQKIYRATRQNHQQN